jgi:hypothetical protein
MTTRHALPLLICLVWCAANASAASTHYVFGLLPGSDRSVYADDQLLYGRVTASPAGELTFRAYIGDDFVVKPSGKVVAIQSTIEVQAFRVVSASPFAVTLNWTASPQGTESPVSSSYELRYASQPLTEDNWSSATLVSEIPAPTVPNEAQYAVVEGLEPGQTYFFALRPEDDSSPPEAFTPEVSATTPDPATLPVAE